MAIDFGATKAKFPGLAAGAPKVAPKPAADGTGMADRDDETVEGEGGAKAALVDAQTALESALSAVKAAIKNC